MLNCACKVIPPPAVAAWDPFLNFIYLFHPGLMASTAFIFFLDELPWICGSTHRGHKRYVFMYSHSAVKAKL